MNTTVEEVDLPTVGSGSRRDAKNTEVPAGDGRNGELFCIGRAWERFQAAERQKDIVEAVRRWRNDCSKGHQWRTKRTEDVFRDVEKFTGTDQTFNFERFRNQLCDETGDEEERRKWFRMLVDVSEESGPGFDYIDPFGPHYGDDVELEDWEPGWMRRVEVKSIDGTPGEGYRVTLTGNEFRMARRSCDLCEGRRYLVRLVFGNRNDDEFEPTEVCSIDDILSTFEDGRERAQVEAWDALRGGRLPLSGSFE